MPRRLKSIRRPVPKPKEPPRIAHARESLVRALADDTPYPEASSPLLSGVAESERGAIVDDAIKLFFTERAARRLPILRERLETWPAMAWGNIFAERPDLKDSLTDEQRERWQAWLSGSQARSLPQVLRMPRKLPGGTG
jgi:hypothetical protein